MPKPRGDVEIIIYVVLLKTSFVGCLLCEWIWIFSVRLCRCRVVMSVVAFYCRTNRHINNSNNNINEE